jgi:hypothetical protein
MRRRSANRHEIRLPLVREVAESSIFHRSIARPEAPDRCQQSACNSQPPCSRLVGLPPHFFEKAGRRGEAGGKEDSELSIDVAGPMVGCDSRFDLVVDLRNSQFLRSCDTSIGVGRRNGDARGYVTCRVEILRQNALVRRVGEAFVEPQQGGARLWTRPLIPVASPEYWIDRRLALNAASSLVIIEKAWARFGPGLPHPLSQTGSAQQCHGKGHPPRKAAHPVAVNVRGAVVSPAFPMFASPRWPVRRAERINS